MFNSLVIHARCYSSLYFITLLFENKYQVLFPFYFQFGAYRSREASVYMSCIVISDGRSLNRRGPPFLPVTTHFQSPKQLALPNIYHRT
jgi:hypothetical protein